MNECFKCGCPGIGRPEAGVFTCRACGARMAHGEKMPRVVVQPHTDRRFVVLSIEDRNVEGQPSEPVQFVVDKSYARMIADAIYSVSS